MSPIRKPSGVVTQKLKNTGSGEKVSHDEGIYASPSETPQRRWAHPEDLRVGVESRLSELKTKTKTKTNSEKAKRLLRTNCARDYYLCFPTTPAGGSPGPQLHAGLRTHLGERAAGRVGTPGPRRGGAGSGSVGFGRARRAESGLRGQLAGGAAGPESTRVGKGRGPRGSKGRGSSPPTAAIGRRWARPAPRGSRT